eukprot:Em0005g1332a
MSGEYFRTTAQATYEKNKDPTLIASGSNSQVQVTNKRTKDSSGPGASPQTRQCRPGAKRLTPEHPGRRLTYPSSYKADPEKKKASVRDSFLLLRFQYKCKAIAEKLQTAFGIDTSGDDLHIHPESMCECCKLSMDRVISAMKNKVHHRSAVVLFQWEKHSNQQCKMCEHFHASAKGGNPKGARPTTGRGRIPGVTPNMIISRINSIAPRPIISPEHPFPRPPLSKDNLSVSVLNQLECPLCVDILAQPIQLPCSTLACAQSANSSATPPASFPLSTTVVKGCCGTLSSEERAAAGLLKRAISTSSKGIIQLGTGGTPVTFMRITNPHNSTTAVCSRTLKSRCSELQAIRRVVSGGQPSVLLQNEVLSLGDEQRRALLKEAGISDEIKIGPAEVLAIKVGLAIPWNKIRILRRWLKASNISLACEERMRHASRKAVGENLKGELAPFSFSLPSGGEEFRGAPLVFIPDLILKVVELLEENDRAGRLTWHNGVIPASEIWIKLGGDKGGGTFKMNFQIVNVAAPNSVNNTCVFCCFEADDSYTNLHIALERYKEQVEHLQGMTWRIWQRLSQHVAMLHPDPYIQSTLTIKNILHQVESGKQPNSFIIASVNPSLTSLLNSLDLELAFYHTEVDQSRYSLYSQELQRLHQYKVELQEAKQSESVLQQLATYMAVLIGESNPLTADLLHQSANTSKIVKQLETKIAASTAVVTREFPLNEGPFVKELDMALQSIGVHRQQYFGGTFVGNHVHKTLKLPNINTLCSAICKLAESSLPQQSEMVATRTMIFLNAFSKFAKCHSIYDQNFIDEAQVHELEQSVQEFMELFRTNFPKGTIPIKMHMVEDHAVQWARSTHVGFGLLGEQGAESVHAKFNNLARAYSAIKGKVHQLKCIVAEHLVSIAPHNVPAIPPPKKRKK